MLELCNYVLLLLYIDFRKTNTASTVYPAWYHWYLVYHSDQEHSPPVL